MWSHFAALRSSVERLPSTFKIQLAEIVLFPHYMGTKKYQGLSLLLCLCLELLWNCNKSETCKHMFRTKNIKVYSPPWWILSLLDKVIDQELVMYTVVYFVEVLVSFLSRKALNKICWKTSENKNLSMSIPSALKDMNSFG